MLSWCNGALKQRMRRTGVGLVDYIDTAAALVSKVGKHAIVDRDANVGLVVRYGKKGRRGE